MASFMGSGFKDYIYDDGVLDYTLDYDLEIANIRPDMTTNPPQIKIDIIGHLKPNNLTNGVEERVTVIEVLATDVTLEPAGE